MSLEHCSFTTEMGVMSSMQCVRMRFEVGMNNVYFDWFVGLCELYGDGRIV